MPRATPLLHGRLLFLFCTANNTIKIDSPPIEELPVSFWKTIFWPWKPFRDGEPLWVSPHYCDYGAPDILHSAHDGLYDDYNGPASAWEFPISVSLTFRFEEWRKAVLLLEEKIDRGDACNFSELDRQGLELAREVKEELPHRDVHYWNYNGSGTTIE